MLPLLAKLNRPIVAILAVGAIAGVLRFNHLGYPERRIFDEYYYPKSACIFLGYSNDRCDINSSAERLWRDQQNDTGAWVHPPLGKWMIALGELGFGTESLGWRVSSAVTGTATVMLLAFIVHLLFASAIWTFVGGLLLAVENLNFVQSRTAMLDIFVTFWIVLGFAFLLWTGAGSSAERPSPAARRAIRPPGPSAIRHPARRCGAASRRPCGDRGVSRPGSRSGPGSPRNGRRSPPSPWRSPSSILWEVSRRRRAGVARPVVRRASRPRGSASFWPS